MRRVAIIGGGLTGSLAAMSVRAVSGAQTVVFDAGRRVGGRVGGGSRDRVPGGDNGAQFFRASTPKFQALLQFLEEKQVVGPWEGRMGILGTRSGSDGFLSRKHMPVEMLASLKPAGGISSDADSGDFCGFIEGRGTLYSGSPSNASICPHILEMSGAEVRLSTRIVAVSQQMIGGDGRGSEGSGWLLASDKGSVEPFDAVIFATHDPSLAAECVHELGMSDESSGNPQVQQRLLELAQALKAAREARVPLFTLSALVECGPGKVPFDAVTVHGSDRIQFLARDACKPGRTMAQEPHELWTCVSTSSLAAWVLEKTGGRAEDGVRQAQLELSQELATLLAPFYDSTPLVKTAAARRWGAAFTNTKTLEGWSMQEENCVALEPFRLAISGDFVRRHCCPIEAAALSGLEAGERVGSWLRQ